MSDKDTNDHSRNYHQGRGNNSLEDTDTRIKQGPITLPSGAVYSGEWRGGMRDGEGTQEWPDGSKYVGYW